MDSFALEIYRDLFLRLSRGNHHGVFSNAKPLFILAIIDSIPNILYNNRIEITNNYFIEIYKLQSKIYNQGKPTPIEKPLYHLKSEDFYQLVWKGNNIHKIVNSPSAKYLRENLAYAKLDDELWLLLQVQENRDYLKQVIINRYLKNNINLP